VTGNGEEESSLYAPAGGSLEPASAASVQARRHYVVQDGPAVYKAAVIGMAEVTEEILKRNDMTAISPGWSRIKPTGASSRRWPSGWASISIASSSISIATAIRSPRRFLSRSRSRTNAGASRTATASSCRPSVRGSPPAASFYAGDRQEQLT